MNKTQQNRSTVNQSTAVSSNLHRLVTVNGFDDMRYWNHNLGADLETQKAND